MKVLVIPSAMTVNKELETIFGKIPYVLLPVNSKPVIDIIYENYNHFDKIIILAKEKLETIENYIKTRKFKIEVVDVVNLVDLGYSIKKGLDYIKNTMGFDSITQFVINLGDTIVDKVNIESSDMIVYSYTEDANRWTTFDHKKGKITAISDKNESINKKDKYCSFVGTYIFRDLYYLEECLSKSLESDILDFQMDSFYQSILLYNEKYDYQFVETVNWLDVGHIDLYYKTNKELKSRFFNSIKIDRDKGIITKRSLEKEKFYNEILWYLKLPSSLQYLIPRIFRYSTDYEDMYVEMEYYGYNTLSELFVYSDLNVEQWKTILNRVFYVINEFTKYQLNLKEDEGTTALNEMYLNKTVNRLNKIRNSRNFDIFYKSQVFINNRPYHSLPFYIDYLKDLLIFNNINKSKNFTIIHGDLCFSNILYDVRTDLIRLIDPRGMFGSFDIYGDIRYDMAKLSHSICGKYDFIINDLYDININGNSIVYELHCNERHNKIAELFHSLLKKWCYDVQQIKLIEATLFLSMVPLHMDSLNRQYLMLATGIQLLDDLINQTNYENLIYMEGTN